MVAVLVFVIAASVQILSKLIAREDLTFEEARQSLDVLLEADVSEQIASYLVLLAAKGEPCCSVSKLIRVTGARLFACCYCC